jgi:hypothetical protein
MPLRMACVLGLVAVLAFLGGAPAAAASFDLPPGSVAVQPPETPTEKKPAAGAPPGWEAHDLPAPIDRVAAGGGGRFLVLQPRGQDRLLIFDVRTGRVAGEVPLPELNVRFTAGLNKLFVLGMTSQVLRRWDLATQREELAVYLPLKGRPLNLAMGAGARGPLACVVFPEPTGGKPPLVLLDTQTLQPLPLKVTGTLGVPLDEVTFLRASADGKAFGVYPPSGRSAGISTATLAGHHLRLARHPGPVVLRVLPAGDGRTFFTPVGLRSPEGKPLAEGPGGVRDTVLVPAVQGNAYVAAAFEGKPGSPQADRCRLAVHVLGEARPALTLPPLDLPRGPGSDVLRPEGRIWLVPDARRLVVIPKGDRRLLWRRLDLDEAVGRAGFPRPVVTSQPPAEVFKGAELVYAVKARGGKGVVRVKLEAGPKGMSASPEGVVRWAVPRKTAEAEVAVVLSLRDEAGAERFHSFQLRLLNPPLPAVDWVHLPAPSAKPAPKADDPLAVKPAPLKKAKESRALSSAVADVVAGGGGRFLILHQPREQQLAVFDTSAARVVGTVPLAEAGARFAAGLEHLLVVLPEARLVQRWDLRTLKRDRSVPLPFKGKVEAVAMGSASRGPLLVGLNGGEPFGLAFLDVERLAPAAVKVPRANLDVESTWRFRAAAAGDVFYHWTVGQGAPPRLIRHTLRDGALQSSDLPLRGGAATEKFFAVPDEQARYVCTSGGRYPGFERSGMEEPTEWPGSLALPAVRGSYYFAVSMRSGAAAPRRRTYTHLSLRRLEADRVAATRSDLELPVLVGEVQPTPFPLTLDKRIWLIPEARLLVVIAQENDRLILQRLDPDAEAEEAGLDYLRLTSLSPPAAVRGKTWRFPLAGKSRRGGNQVRLEAGPVGMDLAPEGALTWEVPADSPTPVEVTLRLRDGTGQEVVERLTVPVRNP